MIEIEVLTRKDGTKRFPEIRDNPKKEISTFEFTGGFLVMRDKTLDVIAIPANEILQVKVTS